MTPNALNRRSMLTGGTLIGLGTLLTACAPHDTTPTGGAATASGAATTSSSSTGNSAGEYRKADAKGPAQNVPKPNAPEDGYREKTAAGIRKPWTPGTNGSTTASKPATTAKHANSSPRQTTENSKSTGK